MKQIYLNMLCNSNFILKRIEEKIKEKEKIDENTLEEIIEEVCLERLYLLETINIPTTNNLSSIQKIESIESAEFTQSEEVDEYNLSVYIDKIISDAQLYIILETIGKTGLSRVKELKETKSFKQTFTSSTGDFMQGTLSKKMQYLEDLDIIDVINLNTGRKGRYENIHSLSTLGIQIYKSILKSYPVESEKFLIKKTYNSLEKGYFVKTVTAELENKGYSITTNTTDNYFTNSFLTKEDKEVIKKEIDLVINKSNKNYIVLCEVGDISDTAMESKLNNLTQVTDTISFIMNNQDSLYKISAKVDKWITKMGREKLKGCTFRLTTLDTLKKKEVWQNKGPF